MPFPITINTLNKIQNVKLQAKIKNNQNQAGHILPRHLLVLHLGVHRKEAQQTRELVGHFVEQILDIMQEHQVQVFSQG